MRLHRGYWKVLVGAVGLGSGWALALGMTSVVGARAALPARPLSGATAVSLSGVSCTSAHACEAVGHYENSSRVLEALAERWNGAKWRVQTTARPSGSTGTTLSEVSCTSAHACEAVGSYTNKSGVNVTLAEVWNGAKWKVQPTRNPFRSADTGLTGVSCTSAHECEAVGFSTNSSGDHKTLAESWNGAKWAVHATPNPSGSFSSMLGAVSCTSAGACEAVGSYVKTVAHNKTLAEVWNGAKWAVQASPNPSGSLTSVLTGVSCTRARACEAVGFNESNSGLLALAERWNGAKWAVRTTPSPAGTGGHLAGVSCASANVCEAVGSYRGSSAFLALAERWNGAKWAIQTTPNPAGPDTSLSEVSCVRTGACEAVGLDSSRSGTLAERWNGTKWSIQATPAPQ